MTHIIIAMSTAFRRGIIRVNIDLQKYIKIPINREISKMSTKI